MCISLATEFYILYLLIYPFHSWYRYYYHNCIYIFLCPNFYNSLLTVVPPYFIINPPYCIQSDFSWSKTIMALLCLKLLNGCQSLEINYNIESVQFSRSVVSNSLRSHELQHARPPCPSPEFTQIHVHWVCDAIQPSHSWSSPSPPAPNPSQHQSLFQWVNSSHELMSSFVGSAWSERTLNCVWKLVHKSVPWLNCKGKEFQSSGGWSPGFQTQPQS